MSVTAVSHFPVLPSEALTSASPRILWIELSSKCPFDCIFCSRKTLRGHGEFMDIALYRKLIAGLRDPEIIRLNYSGESIHHPQLIEAISLAASTGAFVELVTAFSSLPLHQIEALVLSGLDRLTVSIHTLDTQEYKDIYGFSSASDLHVRLEALRECQTRLGRRKPVLDFAFVAMQRNLDQIRPLACYARSFGVRDVFVHPLIRRDEIPLQFPAELEGSRLKSSFLTRLKQGIDEVQSEFEDVRFPVSTHEIDPVGGIDGHPRHYPGPLPAEARIYSCDQSPWDSVHVLANGDVVTCEVKDRTALGNLSETSLDGIWHGAAYRAFRRDYQLGRDKSCSTCAYKLAYVPGPVAGEVRADHSHCKELISGWYSGEGEIVWSKRRSRVILSAGDGTAPRSIELAGLLPPGPDGEPNSLEVFAGTSSIGTVANDTKQIKAFSVSFVVPAGALPEVCFDFVTRFRFSPIDQGSEDVRELGFALQQTRLCTVQAEVRRPVASSHVRPLLFAWKTAMAVAPLARRIRRAAKQLQPYQPGISVVIPERATPDHLEPCLESLKRAFAEVEEPAQIVVSLNGATQSAYRTLADRFPRVEWVTSSKPLGFGGAVNRGLKMVKFDWVYLLNSDMVLHASALRQLASYRANDIFAIGSQIFFADTNRRREETGWTGFRFVDGCAEIFDRDPQEGTQVRAHLYAGGGSSLFRTDLLRRFAADTQAYHPMYFEDAEWGLRGWREGFQTLFVPTSKVTHTHRATVNRLFAPEEVERIFSRNQLLFSLRNGFCHCGADEIRTLLSRRCGLQTQRELGCIRNALALLRALLKNAAAPCPDFDFSQFQEQ